MSRLVHIMVCLLPLTIAAVAGCADDDDDDDDDVLATPGDGATEDKPPVVPAAVLPIQSSPSQAVLPRSGEVDGAYLADVDSCGQCHPDAFAQQQASAHAFASFNNPIYRALVDGLREQEGLAPSVMCAGCHDASLLIDGAMDAAISADDPRAHNGVSCRLCHGIKSANRAGNGSYVLHAEPIPLPSGGDPATLRKHVLAATPLPMATLCGACHDSFLSPSSGNPSHLAGQNEFSSWSDSAYAGNGAGLVDQVEPRSCVQCHMPKVAAELGDVAADATGRMSSHAFLGGHTYLAAMRGDPDLLERNQELLRGVMRIDVMAERDGDDWLLDVVMRNIGAGHHFPGGVRDAANTWIEVDVLDGEGQVIARSSKEDPHRLRALVADSNGQLVANRETQRFVTAIADHTIGPRQVALVRYRSADATRASSVRVRLLHQSRSAEVAAIACLESRSERGLRFKDAATELGRETVDGCAAMPITEVASIDRRLGETVVEFSRHYERGLGLMGAVQERASAARPSLEQALRLASSPAERAMALTAIGQLQARLGQASDALASLEQARRLAPKSAAIPAARGDALARVWRWPEAAEAYAEALEIAGGNASLWRKYAVALGSSAQDRKALVAAQRGLRLRPRDAHLLRVQALALQSLGAEDAELAMTAYLDHRGADDASEILLKCTQQSALCARESLKVHEHTMHAVASGH